MKVKKNIKILITGANGYIGNCLYHFLKGKFKVERGRINCSLWEEGEKWRWLGIQYVIAEY